jgi:hypothetical protein
VDQDCRQGKWVSARLSNRCQSHWRLASLI